MRIRIDNEPFLIKATDAPDLTDTQRDLLKILCSIASLSNASNVRSEVLMELLGVQKHSSYAFRMKNLQKKGLIEPRESTIANLEALVKS